MLDNISDQLARLEGYLTGVLPTLATREPVNELIEEHQKCYHNSDIISKILIGIGSAGLAALTAVIYAAIN